MDFFYPNCINDMWRIFGLLLEGDKNHFVDIEAKTFRKADIEEVRHLASIGAGEPEQLKGFATSGYSYDESRSTEDTYVFLK